VRASRSGGLPLALLQGAQWRARAGAERFQRAAGTPPRSLKKQFQAAGVPAWSRDAPLLFAADGTLLFVPGLGTDARALAAPGTPRVSLDWVDGR
jgi:tRNA(Ile)-lysidine synthase